MSARLPAPRAATMRFPLAVIVVACATAAVLPRPIAAADAPPVVFDGLGLEGFAGTGSIAAELARLDREAEREGVGQMPALAVAAPAVANRDAPPVPLNAELRSRVASFDVAAGLVADSKVVRDGPARWTGRVGIASTHEAGLEAVELRTIVGNNDEWGLLGVELGPRLERRMRHGATFFIDGKAEAQAMRSTTGGWWTAPGTPGDRSSAVGVMARTGLVR
jgi:hypothetical protein